MHKMSFSLVCLALAACGTSNPIYDEMVSAKWANSGADCSKIFTTFDNRMIRHHFPDGVSDFGKIIDVQETSDHTPLLIVEPSDTIKEAALKRNSKTLPNSVSMAFTLKNGRLQLWAMVSGKNGEIGGIVKPQDIEFRLFDLKKCPA